MRVGQFGLYELGSTTSPADTDSCCSEPWDTRKSPSHLGSWSLEVVNQVLLENVQ
jgi:hypothetical protein